VPDVWRESGAIYCWTRTHWETVGDRMWGDRMVPFYMDETSSSDIDTPRDLEWCRWLAETRGL
jgi:CMP-N-acetylneuraminic acid synthetase